MTGVQTCALPICYTSLDYDEGDKIADLGVKGAEKKKTMLSKLSVDDATWAQYNARKQARRIEKIATPQFVTVEGAGKKLDQAIETQLEPFKGEPLDSASLERSLTRITGMGRFSALSYQMVEQDGKDGLVINAVPKGYAPPVLKPGVFIESSGLSNIQFGLGARITYQDIGGFRSEWRTDILLGSTYSAATEFYRPFTEFSKWFVAPHIDGATGPVDFYQRGKEIAEYQVQHVGGGLDLGYLFNRDNEVRVGYNLGYKSISLNTGEQNLPTVSGGYGDAALNFTHDGLEIGRAHV